MAILYLETNFLIGIAKGQDPRAEEVLSQTNQGTIVTIPSVCFMEALSTLDRLIDKNRVFHDQLSEQFREVKRDLGSETARRLQLHLNEASRAWADYEIDILRRFSVGVGRLSEVAAFLPLLPEVVQQSLNDRHIDDPTDNLILHCILDHAGSADDGPRAFLSGNSKDFDQPRVNSLLESVGIRYFRRADAVLGWLGSQPA